MRRGLRDRIPFLDLREYRCGDLGHDLSAAATVTFMSVPQGVAYAMIAGLPPAMGLYSACLPTIVGSLTRSSRHVVTGPTNALSLLVGTAGAAAAGLDPVPTALLLAFLVGVIQLSAGVLRLGSLVDFISIPVVVGYIAGAGLLIGVGQLPNLTETAGARGNLVEQLAGWAANMHDANGAAVALGALTALAIVGLRRFNRKIPAAMVVLSVATLASWRFELSRVGLRTVEDLAPIPAGFPPITLPTSEWSFDGWQHLLPIAIAATVLSLVESSAVGRAISAKSGQRLDLNAEFAGQGLANIVSAFFGGYATSGSLSRSALNHQTGARTRLAGVFSGLMLLAVLLFLGPLANYTPIAALAGLLLVVAVDLVDVRRVVKILKARRSDAVAFLLTVAGTWAFRLDHAIYVGVAVSVFLYLRRARLLVLHHVVFDAEGRMMELRLDDHEAEERGCERIKVLNVEGQLFFGAASELQNALDQMISDRRVDALIVRLRRAQGLDLTCIEALEGAAARMKARGRHLFVVGFRDEERRLLERTGAAAGIGRDHLVSTTLTWFEAADTAMIAALKLVGPHGDRTCPITRHLAREELGASPGPQDDADD